MRLGGAGRRLDGAVAGNSRVRQFPRSDNRLMVNRVVKGVPAVKSLVPFVERRSRASSSRALRLTALAAAIPFALSGLAGCASSEDLRRLSEEPGFVQGFGDGCATAREEDKSFSTKRVRDEYEFENDEAYRAGWRQGYLDCRGQIRPRNDGGVVLGNEPDL